MAKGGGKDSNDGCATGVGVVVVGGAVVIAAIPKEVWIVLGIIGAGALLTWLVVVSVNAAEKRRAEAEVQARQDQAAQLAAAQCEREGRARTRKRRRVEALGAENAARLESALTAVKEIGASEAARAGWLGDVDFTTDLQGIAGCFRKSHALRKVSGELSALDKPSPEDRKILEEAKVTVAELENTAIERVELIGRCAREARLIDESLRQERDDARTAEQRAELHGKLSGMLYGIEATRETTSMDSAADRVMARVEAYREIKNQIQLIRDP